MRGLSFTVTVVLAVTVAVAAVAYRPAEAQARDGVFRVATFNIHKGLDSQDRYNLQRTIETIAAFDADVVGMQEVMRDDPYFKCEDQAALIAEGLTRLTQRKWTFVFVKSWITENRECITRGLSDDVATEGVALFSPQRILQSDSIRLAESRVGVQVTVASMPDVPVITTHLASGRRFQEHRFQQIGALLPWAEASKTGIFLGDFNSRPDAHELVPVMARYRDAWLEATDKGAALVPGTCCTSRPNARGRIDYVFYDPTGPLTLEAVEVRETGSDGLSEVSDHRPVIATFRRTPSRALATQ